MRVYWTLTRRELAGYFVSQTGYVLLASVVFLLGLSFWNMIVALQSQPTPMPLTELFYETLYFWVILLFIAPIITMRLFALEKFSGTFETLMTVPVKDVEVVLAKFSAAFFFYLVIWLPLILYVFILRRFSTDPAGITFGSLASTYLGIILLGLLYISVGTFASAVTRSQIIAAMIAFLLGISLFMLSFLSERVNPEAGWSNLVLAQISMVEHMRDFAGGIVDTRHIVYYLSLTGLFLFLTVKVLESRRWK